MMSEIRPVSDLRNNFADISAQVRKAGESVILTKNGYADMVVMSYETYTRRQFEEEIYLKLMEAEIQARSETERIPLDDVRERLSEMLLKRKYSDVQD